MMKLTGTITSSEVLRILREYYVKEMGQVIKVVEGTVPDLQIEAVSVAVAGKAKKKTRVWNNGGLLDFLRELPTLPLADVYLRVKKQFPTISKSNSIYNYMKAAVKKGTLPHVTLDPYDKVDGMFKVNRLDALKAVKKG